jgi:ATP-dependent Lon protease
MPEGNKSRKPQKMETKSQNKKRSEESDEDSLYTSDSEENEELDETEYRKFLSKLFPSKHLDNKIKAGNQLKKVLKEEMEKEYKKSKDEKKTKSKEEKVKTKSKNKKSEESESEEEKVKTKSKNKSEESESEESESEETKNSKKESKFNIIFTIGDEEEEYDDSEDEFYDVPEEETEDEDEEVSSSDEESEEPRKKTKKDKKESDPKEEEELMSELKQIYGKYKSNPLVQKVFSACKTDIEKRNVKKSRKENKQKEKNARIYKKIVKDKNTMNDFAFFEFLEIDAQKKIIKEMREINKLIRVEKPYRMSLLESNMPTLFKSVAMKKINSLRYMESGSGEYYKIKNWVSTFMSIPFGVYHSLPINIADGVEKCHEFMETSQKILNDAVYGLNDAKMQIMQMVGQLVTNPKSIGSAIAIHGPPGTGKTSLVKEGISKILGRPFAFIALGGATDSSFLEGHGYTYEGSTWGKIVQILIDSKCMNPVIYFDELDKISDTPKGEEIAGILTHLTDTTQNSQFHDKYFSEIDFDLSKCLFIFSYNDETKVNPILKDRMYRIQTKGYNQKQKTCISGQYLLPKIREQVKFEAEDIIIPDETIHYITENLCNKEDGVRNLKRCLEIIYTKLNLYRLMKPGSNLFEEDMSLKVEFPFKVTKDMVDKLIKRNSDNTQTMYSLYV